jgi:glycosyltransferase involved in cell wall biosynthesis
VGLGCAAPPLVPERQKALFFERFPELKSRRLLLFLGRLHDKKGCDLLVRAFGEMQAKGRAEGMTLVMAGPPSSEAYLRSLQHLAEERCGARSVVFPGMLSGDLKWGAFQAAEVFALPSHQENFGLAVVEALACGCPVLISQQINIWREIENEGAGLVEADDLIGTLRLLERWEDASPDARGEMAAAARRAFAARFEIHQAAARLGETIERCLAQG